MLEKLYDYQKEAVSAALAVDLGTVVLPTGTGKTFCQAAIISSDIQKAKESPIYIVNCPRILLSFQLLKEVYFFLSASGVDARYMFVHSGGATECEEMEEIRLKANKINTTNTKVKFAQIESSTSTSEIEDSIKMSKRQGLPLIIFSTYHSCLKIETARKNVGRNIRMMLNDEAHYLTQEEFHKILSGVSAEKKYFFTATARYTTSVHGRGMNNIEKFGNIVYAMTPREAIERGKMVRPRIHTFFSPDVNSFEDFQKSMPKIIFNAYIHHSKVIEEEQDNKAKILVACKGVGDIKNFLQSEEYQKLRKMNVNIFAVASSDEVGNKENEQTMNRKSFLRRLKECGENKNNKMIVLHYDILAEGIDVSGFTGILPLRSMAKSKFLQTYGRAARLHPEDRKAFERGDYKPSDVERLRKPYAYVLAPNVAQGNEDDYENITQLIYSMREFDFSCVENIVTSEIVNGIPEPEIVDGLNDVEGKLRQVGQIIEKIESEIEEKEIASLSKKGKIKRALRKSASKKAIKLGKKRRVKEFKVYNSSQEVKDEEGLTNCNKVSKNNSKDIAKAIANNSSTSGLANHFYHIDGPNSSHMDSWNELVSKNPDYKGKYLVPVFIYE